MTIFRKAFWQKEAEALDAIGAGDLAMPPTRGASDTRDDVGDATTSLVVSNRRNRDVRADTDMAARSVPTAPKTLRRVQARLPAPGGDDEVYFTTKQAAAFLGHIYSFRSLERMRCTGNQGPRFKKMPGEKGRILYPKSELVRWLQDRAVYTSTSEYPDKQ
jgi:hypothetical protein